MDFLWNRIRVQGGAYGSFARFARNGNMYFCSYRDPNLKETLSVYDEAADYLSSFDGNRREMTKYILGTISKMDAPLTPSMKGEAASDHFIRHITQEDIQQTRNEVLSTTQHDIRGFSEMVSEVMKQNHYCVIGDGEIIKNNSDMFDELVSVF
jgi:Zn-dependent M16 (insulinase) family peptidase